VPVLYARPLARPRTRRIRRYVPSKTSSSLAAGTASFVSSGPGGISLSATDATSGTAPYTYQWQRSTTSGSGFSDLTGETSLTATDDTASAGTLYYYRLVYTDNASATATSNEVSAQVYSGGALTGGGGRVFGSSVFGR
jgi:hypothetical protein